MNRIVSLAALSLVSVALGCGAEPTVRKSSSAGTPPVDDAIADAETGHDLPAAKTRLDALLTDATLSKVDHAKVALALSRIVEASDRERAIQLVEDAVASESDDAKVRLHTLLTGSPPPKPWSRRVPSKPTTNAARALAKYYPPATPDRDVQVEIASIGGDDRGASPSSGFDIAEALRDNALAACGLCDDVKTRIRTSISRASSWTDIPSELPRLEHALVVTYVDAETIPPARYERWFAVPIGDMQKAIAAGAGLVAVKERSGAPPLVTMVAPRAALLHLVEEQFAEMSELPVLPRRLELDGRLSPEEVRAGVRSRFGAYKTCYESLLARRPAASGTIELAFAVKSDGTVDGVTSTVDGTLDDAPFRSCIVDAARSIHYASWSCEPAAETTVRYPITLAP